MSFFVIHSIYHKFIKYFVKRRETMKILILGASGLVGKALIKELSPDHDVYGTFNQTELELTVDHQLQWDINDSEKILNWIDRICPDVIVSCLRGDFIVQFEAHARIVEKIKSTPTRLLFCSTTNVFDGDVTKHHAETDPPVAESDYGQFKIKCEELIKNELGERGVILRLPMVWGKQSPRLKEIKNKIENGQEIEAYDNIYLNHAIDTGIASQVKQIIANDLKGIFHLATTDIDSQYAFIWKLVKDLSPEGKVKSLTLENYDKYNFGLLINRTDLESGFYYDNGILLDQLVK
ncbi:dTDP-4-dehydrorhamnose reductase [Bacillus sp. AFS017336]|nr:dTDP-4-dehydrorhamnose reductase [Bacillus sp. AFS017336]